MKFLLAGDSDVGKDEILRHLQMADEDASPVSNTIGLDNITTSPSTLCSSPSSQAISPTAISSPSSFSMRDITVAYKSTNVLLDGKRIRLQLWDTSGQGRFSTIIRSYSRGAQGILLVYDITRKWSFNGLDRWIKEIEEHAPGIPKILIGNRLHLAFNRQVEKSVAEHYAKKHKMSFFEVSHLCDYSIREALVELCRMVLIRNGIDNIWKNQVLSLQDLCCRTIVAQTDSVSQLKLPSQIKEYLKSYSHQTSSLYATYHHQTTSSSSSQYPHRLCHTSKQNFLGKLTLTFLHIQDTLIKLW